MLTGEDLVYMRETQAQAREVPAVLTGWETGARDALGEPGRVSLPGVPLMVRLDGTPDVVPVSVAGRLTGGDAVKIVTDLVPVRAGDVLYVGTDEAYEVLTDGDPDRWATAQVVFGRRVR